ncbi:MAG TPA: GNAT family N-acetyltransferase [Ruminococcaceae bacterium]|nr:GNAT family N-acetyltransferase [Oscillospiraceae bacterium]
MSVSIRKFNPDDVRKAAEIWNEIVRAGNAFPQIDELDEKTGEEFFQSQSYTGIAADENGEIVGLYILHPNNVGRCGHICNASYAVKSGLRGKHIGEALVRDCIKTAKRLGFGILQFNAVVRSNKPALALYEKLGFVKLGVIPKGFLMKDGTYEDIIPHYIEL